MTKQQKGFRKGVTKEDILKLTDEEKKRIRLWREVDEVRLEKGGHSDAYKCGVLSDQLYLDLDKKVGTIESHVFSILSLKSKIDRNKKQMETGKITSKYPNSDEIMGVRDLEIESVMSNRMIGEHLRELWTLIIDIYRYVNQPRIDGEVFTRERYDKKIKWVKEELKKQGIDLYQERF